MTHDPWFWIAAFLCVEFVAERALDAYRAKLKRETAILEAIEERLRRESSAGIQAEAMSRCHDRRCPAVLVKNHPCHNLDCKEHKHPKRAA